MTDYRPKVLELLSEISGEAVEGGPVLGGEQFRAEVLRLLQAASGETTTAPAPYRAEVLRLLAAMGATAPDPGPALSGAAWRAELLRMLQEISGAEPPEGAVISTQQFHGEVLRLLQAAASEPSEFLISDYAEFKIGWGNWVDSDYKRYDSHTYAKGATANTMEIHFRAGDTFTLPDYTTYKFHLIDFFSNATDVVYVAKDSKQDYTLTAEEANHVKSILVAHISADPLTADDLAWINANARIVRG